MNHEDVKALVARIRGRIQYAKETPTDYLEMRLDDQSALLDALEQEHNSPSRDEFIRALRNVLVAYGHRMDGTGRNELDSVHLAEARKLLATVLPNEYGTRCPDPEHDRDSELRACIRLLLPMARDPQTPQETAILQRASELSEPRQS